MHPGAVLLEMMAEEFSLRSGLSASVVEEIVAGRQEITDEIAVRLSSGSGVSVEFWQNFERSFREGLAAGKTWIK